MALYSLIVLMCRKETTHSLTHSLDRHNISNNFAQYFALRSLMLLIGMRV